MYIKNLAVFYFLFLVNTKFRITRQLKASKIYVSLLKRALEFLYAFKITITI